jgi:hypothetical protein
MLKGMISLFAEDVYHFRFAEPRWLNKFHLEKAVIGTPVVLTQWYPETDGRGEGVAQAHVGDGGWVTLPGAILVTPQCGFTVSVVSLVE